MDDSIITDQYGIYHGDACELLPQFPSASIHLSIHSPPFATKRGGALYHYSSDIRDLSNSDTYEDFFTHYRFIAQELFRLTLPGRMAVVHCADVPNGNTGDDDLTDFPGDILRLYQSLGWRYKARFCIWKDALRVRNRTMAKVLAHKTIVEDSAYSGNAGADYLLVLQKIGKNAVPIAHREGFQTYAGDWEPPPDILRYRGWQGKQTENRYSHWIWQRYASALWDDIRADRVLPYQAAKAEDDEKHVHPLQLDVIDRCLILYSNPGETVLTPFMGVGSEVYAAVAQGRRAIGLELKPSYYRQAVANIPEALKARLLGEDQALLPFMANAMSLERVDRGE
jgi:DNA modification methylase